MAGYIQCRYHEESYKRAYSSWENKLVAFKGSIVSEPDIREYGVYYYFRPEGEKWLIRLFTSDINCSLGYGDLVETEFLLEKPKGQRNPGSFDFREYLKTRRTAATGDIKSINIKGFKPESSLKYLSIKIKYKLLACIRKYLPGKKSGLAAAMLIGEKSNIEEELQENFKASGIAHLLTVSGGHALFFLAPISWLLKKMRLSRRIACIAEILAAIAFCYISGLGIAIIRATIMIVVRKIACLINKSYDSINSLCMAAFLLLLANPYNLFSSGYQLSMAASMAIIILTDRFQKLLGGCRLILILPDKLKKSLLMSLSAQAGILPIQGFLFMKIPLTGLLANIIVTPLLPFLYVWGIGLLLTDLTGLNILAAVFSYILYFNGFIIEVIAEAFGNLAISQLNISPNIVNLLAYYIFLYVLIFFNPCVTICSHKLPSKHKVRTVLLILAALLSVLPFNAYYRGMELIFIDVGQGDSCLIRLPGNVQMLVDTGISGREVRELLLYKNISKIDILFISHPHADHGGGAIELMKEFKIGQLAVPDLASDEAFEAIFALAEKKGIPVTRLSCGSRIQIGRDACIFTAGPFMKIPAAIL